MAFFYSVRDVSYFTGSLGFMNFCPLLLTNSYLDGFLLIS